MNIKQLQDFYFGQTDKECLKIKIVDGLQQIVLIRHAEPDLQKDGFFTGKEAAEFRKKYKIAGVKYSNNHPICTEELPELDIFHSSLRRAEHTAELFFRDKKFSFIKSDDFVEFDRSDVGLLNLKLPIRWWNFISRFLWFLGFDKDHQEKFPEARERVKIGAARLEEYTSRKGIAILVAHGIYNKFIGFELYKKSWRKVLDQGSGYTAIKIFAKNAKE